MIFRLKPFIAVVLIEREGDLMEIKCNRSDPAHGTVCPRSSDPFYIVSYYINWVTTSLTHSINK